MSLEKRTKEAADAIAKIVTDLDNSSRIGSEKVMRKLGHHLAVRLQIPIYTRWFYQEGLKGAEETIGKEKARHGGRAS